VTAAPPVSALLQVGSLGSSPALRCVESSERDPMGPSVVSRLAGRKAEVTGLGRLIEHDRQARVVLVHGPTGIGKTALLHAASSLCDRAGISSVMCDSGEGFAPDLRDVPVPAANGSDASVAERLVYLFRCRLPVALRDALLFEEVLPRLAPGALMIVASRQGPSPRWMLHPGWGTALRALSVGALVRTAAMDILERQGVPEEVRDDLCGFGEGNPLLLMAAAGAVEARPAGAFSAPAAEDALRKLLPTLGVRADTPNHRMALRCCAIPMGTTPEMLAAVLGDASEAEEAFRWLSQQTFIDDTPCGLRPHVAVRRGLLQELRVLYPAELLRLHRAIKHFCVSQVEEAVEPERWIANILYIDGQLSDVHTYLPWDEACTEIRVAMARASDWGVVHRAVIEHEGEQSARILQHWAGALPESIEVVHAASREPRGLLVTLPLEHDVITRHLDHDPALRVVREHQEKHTDHHQDDQAILYRYWMDLAAHQVPTPTLTRVITHMMARAMGLQRLCCTYVVVRDADGWVRFALVLGLPVERAGSFSLDGEAFTIVALGCRERDRMEWLADFGERSMTGMGQVWWQRVTGQRGSRSDGGQLRETLRPGAPGRPRPLATGGLGDLIKGRMEKLAKEAQLTTREMEVLDLLLLGRNAEEMALVLEISPRTVKFHQGNVLRKLGADSKTDLVRLLL
jgi:DNA-binding CsgD family transcriptional regulator